MKTILVVEDEGIIADDIRETLMHLGYAVPEEPIARGEDVAASIARSRPDLVLMDIHLAGKIDGVEAARVVRAEHDVPVVFLTAHSDDATLARAKRAGPYGYLLKPFNVRELRTTIEVALEKHGLEAALRRSERWFSTTLASIGDAVVATDTAGRVTFLNLAAERLSGWTSDEARGRALDDIFALVGEDGAPLVNTAAGVAPERGFSVLQPENVALRRRDGTQRWVGENAAPIVADRGEVLGMVLAFRDVTAKRELEERAARAERLASLGTLSAGVAHEINNPLAVILANASLAKGRLRKLASTETEPTKATEIGELADALDDVCAAANLAHRVVQDLMRFVRAESVERGRTDLPDAIAIALRLVQGATRDVTRVVEELGTTPFVAGGEAAIVQIITNLVANAAQAFEQRDTTRNLVTVKTQTTDEGNAVLIVRDNGRGIRDEHVGKIFEPFFTTKSGGGTGLGLSITHGIVRGLGGKIRVESEVGIGSTFHVELPAVRASVEEIRPKTTDAPSEVRRILIVDDDDIVGRATSRILTPHRTTVVQTVDAALAVLATDSFDVALLDVRMPGRGGLDLYEELERLAHPLLPRIAFVTGGVADQRDEARLQRTGRAVLAKPVARSQLLRAVDILARSLPNAAAILSRLGTER